MDTQAFLDELFAIRGEHQRTLTDLDYEGILTECLAACDRAAAGRSPEERAALRRTLEEFLFTRVAALLLPADYRAFVKLLRASGVNGDAVYGEKGRFIPARFLKLRIFLYMLRTNRILFFDNQYRLLSKKPVKRFFRFVRRVISGRSLEPFRYILPGHLWMMHISVITTTRCTLRCKYCGSLMNLYEHPEDTDSAVVLETLDRLQRYTDRIDWLMLIGGESFCDPNLKRYIRAISGDVCRHIEIATNGTILPDDPELIAALRDRQVYVNFSNYGPLSRKQEEFIALLRRENIPYTVESKNRQWYDDGGFEERSGSRKDFDRQFSKCGSSNIISVFKGRVYSCPRAAHGHDLGLVDIPEDEYVDILHLDKKEFIKQMKKKLLYRNRAPVICRHCSYNDDCRAIPRGEQEERCRP